MSACISCNEKDEIIVIDDHSHCPAETSLKDINDTRIRVERLPDTASGVSAARNFGLDVAQANLVAFLDDDDELLPHYIDYIHNTAAPKSDYGFSSYVTVTANRPADKRMAKVRFAEGHIASTAPLRKRTFGFGMGFWMTRKTADRIGPLDTTLTINEDTDYACRLSRAGLQGWYASKPGVIVHDHSGGADGQKGNMTGQIDAAERARCMKELCIRYPEFIQHLGMGYIRHCLRSGSAAEALNFIRAQQSHTIRFQLSSYLWLKKLGYALGGKRRTKIEQN